MTFSVFVVTPFLRRYGCLFTYDQFSYSVSPAANITQWKNNTPAVMSGYSVHTVVAKGTSTDKRQEQHVDIKKRPVSKGNILKLSPIVVKYGG